MTDRTLPAETRAEGFAFFAWHRLMWPPDPAYTFECRHVLCWRLWEGNDR